MHDRLFAHKKKSANLKEGKELLITFSGHRQIFFMKILNDFPKWDIFTSIELASSIHVHHSHVLQLTIEENFNRKKKYVNDSNRDLEIFLMVKLKNYFFAFQHMNSRNKLLSWRFYDSSNMYFLCYIERLNGRLVCCKMWENRALFN